MKYYIAENGQPAGPFELNELTEHGLTVNSQVWNETMETWTAAGNVPELRNLLNSQAQQQQYAPGADYAREQPPQPQSPYAPRYDQPEQYNSAGYTQPQYPLPQQYAQPQYAPMQAPMPADWKAANVVMLVLGVLCCNVLTLITGIVGVVKSGNVRAHYNSGDLQGALQASHAARTWFIVSMVLLLLGVFSLFGLILQGIGSSGVSQAVIEELIQ